MDHHGPLLFAVWREACRHIEMEVFMETLAGLLRPEMALAEFGVVRLDRAADAT